MSPCTWMRGIRRLHPGEERTLSGRLSQRAPRLPAPPPPLGPKTAAALWSAKHLVCSLLQKWPVVRSSRRHQATNSCNKHVVRKSWFFPDPYPDVPKVSGPTGSGSLTRPVSEVFTCGGVQQEGWNTVRKKGEWAVSWGGGGGWISTGSARTRMLSKWGSNPVPTNIC